MKNNRKKLREEYKNRQKIGGVFCLKNTETNQFILQSTANMQGAKNRFDFSVTTDSPPISALKNDWKKYGKHAFVMEECELLEKEETQTEKQFLEDLELLLEIWDQKLPKENRY